MATIPVPIPTPIYHITLGHNLRAILQAGGLKCWNELQQTGTNYTTIAYSHIQDRRAAKQVPCGPQGTLHDYVPFYFAPRSPMLFTISQGNVPSFSKGQRPVLHLVSTAQEVDQAGLQYVFTNGHGTMHYTDFFDDLAQLDQVDWSVMPLRDWYDTLQSPDRKRKRQAEFLVHGFVPWNLVTEIGVIDDGIRSAVEAVFESEGAAHRPVVNVQRTWYY